MTSAEDQYRSTATRRHATVTTHKKLLAARASPRFKVRSRWNLKVSE